MNAVLVSHKGLRDYMKALVNFRGKLFIPLREFLLKFFFRKGMFEYTCRQVFKVSFTLSGGF